MKAEDLLSSLQVDDRQHGASCERRAGADKYNLYKFLWGQAELQWDGQYAQEEIHCHVGHGHRKDLEGLHFGPVALLLHKVSSRTRTLQGPEHRDEKEKHRKEEE